MRNLRIFFAGLVGFVVVISCVLYRRYLNVEDVIPILESPIPVGQVSSNARRIIDSSTPIVDSLSMPTFHDSIIHSGRNDWSSAHGTRNSSLFKFFLVAPPEYTTTFLQNYTERASHYYQNHLNEESAEIWLHRGFEQMIPEQTTDPSQAHVILIAGYFHLHAAIHKTKESGANKRMVHLLSLLDRYQSYLTTIHQLQDPTMKSKPHLLLIPTWNPTVANTIGIKDLCQRLQENGYTNLWSVGFERNSLWQGLSPQRIIPIPYVVRFDTVTVPHNSSLPKRSMNSVFYAGERRPHAKVWAGCHRDKLLLPLLIHNNTTSSTPFDVQLVTKRNRMDQEDYNHRMKTSDYCLILCGDTPSSRTLTSAMVWGCIPIRVGSRLRGLCEAPCHGGFGWKPTGDDYPHLPFSESIPWSLFPEVNEQQFMDAGNVVLTALFRNMASTNKENLRSIMNATRSGWIYGFGDPVYSTDFGDATRYIWQSFLAHVQG